MLGFIRNFVWGLIKLCFFGLGLLAFLQEPVGWTFLTLEAAKKGLQNILYFLESYY